MYVDVVLNSKGGTGKTTFAANTAALLADRGQKRVLLVDGDKQPTLSSIFDLDHRAQHGMSTLIREGPHNPDVAQACISRTVIPRLDIIISDAGMGELETWVMQSDDGRVRLRMALSHFVDHYDHVIIDTCGAVGPIQGSAIFSADRIISPLPPTILPTREFARGTIGMMARVSTLIKMMSLPLPPIMIVPYMVDHTVDAQAILTAIRQPGFGSGYAGQVNVLDTTVPTYVIFREAARARIPIHQLPNHRAAKAQTAFAAVIAELYPHIVMRLPEIA